MDNLLNWLSEWYSQHCDGAWEHIYSVHIKNLDNPGWELSVDLGETELDGIAIPYQFHELGKEEWYGYKTENNKFVAFGSVLQLNQILLTFKKLTDGDLKYLYININNV